MCWLKATDTDSDTDTDTDTDTDADADTDTDTNTYWQKENNVEKVTTTTWATGPTAAHPFFASSKIYVKYIWGCRYGYGYVQMSRVLNCINSFNDVQIEAAAAVGGLLVAPPRLFCPAHLGPKISRHFVTPVCRAVAHNP
uniref:HDC19173 n=1 Tax=Drosophila melanogaster TaxID=7227 RepID=Q6IIA8_DROME|nr:TPA_inf: HDC19173 [Drosophila melanogaster]